MNKYSFIVTACVKYTPELNALLNSLDYVGSKADVHLWYYKVCEGLINEWEEKLGFELIAHKIPEQDAREYGGESEILCRKRYWYAGEIGKQYSAICVLDADMVFVRNPVQFFKIAEDTGFIIGVHKEQNKVYDDPHHTVNGQWIIEKGYYNDRDLCNAPLFLDARVWEIPLKESWGYFISDFPVTNFKAPDMDAMNIAFLKYGAKDKVIKLSNHSWLGTNESLLKPYTRACMDRSGLIKTENGQDVFSYHGQYYKKKWRQQQLINRAGCAQGYLGCNFKSNNMAEGAMNCLTEYFRKMCFNHKVTVEKKDYVHPEEKYEE